MKSVAKNILFSLVVIGGLFLTLEGVQRVRYALRDNPRRWLLYGLNIGWVSSVQEVFRYDVDKRGGYYKMRPGVSRAETPRGIREVYINGYGFRGPDFPLEKPRGTFRMVVLGGSSTFGALNGDDETFPAILQRLLDAREGRGRFEVINAGIPGANPAMLTRLLREEILPLRPDLVIIMSLYNHYFVTTEGDARGPLPRLRRFLEGRSLLVLTLSEKLTYFTAKSAFLEGLYVRFSDYRAYMQEMVETAQGAGTAVFLIKEPVLIQGERSKNLLPGSAAPEQAWDRDFYAKTLKVIDTVGRDRGLPVVDASSLTGVVRMDMLYDAVHLTREGNEAIAREILRELERSGPLARR